MHPKSHPAATTRAENAALRARLEEAEALLRALHRGDADALVIQSPTGPQVYILQGHDAEAKRLRGEMLAQVSDAVIAVDDQNSVTYLNASAERLYGLNAADALGRKLTEIFETKWLRPEDEATARMALEDHSQWRGENVHIRRDGSWLNVESGITLLRDAVGQASGMLAVIRDMTERKHQEIELLVSELRYRRLFETALDGVIIIDPATRKIIDANPFMTRMLGYSHDELVGLELFEIGLLKDNIESQKLVHDLTLSNPVRYDHLPLRSRNGRQQEVEVVANLYDENGWPVIQCNIRDITERKRAEDHAQVMMAEVNHRSKNLLAVVQAVVRQTAKYGDPLIFAARLSERIDALADGHDLLVENLWRGVEVADLVKVQLAHFRDLIGSRIVIDGPPMMLTTAAAQGIGMALHELTTNAAKYGALSNPDGQVCIVWQTQPGAKPMFSMSWSENGGPKVVPPTRTGFGRIVMGRLAEAAVDGVVDVAYPEKGFAWKIRAPVANVLALQEGASC